MATLASIVVLKEAASKNRRSINKCRWWVARNSTDTNEAKANTKVGCGVIQETQEDLSFPKLEF